MSGAHPILELLEGEDAGSDAEVVREFTLHDGGGQKAVSDTPDPVPGVPQIPLAELLAAHEAECGRLMQMHDRVCELVDPVREENRQLREELNGAPDTPTTNAEIERLTAELDSIESQLEQFRAWATPARSLVAVLDCDEAIATPNGFIDFAVVVTNNAMQPFTITGASGIYTTRGADHVEIPAGEFRRIELRLRKRGLDFFDRDDSGGVRFSVADLRLLVGTAEIKVFDASMGSATPNP